MKNKKSLLLISVIQIIILVYLFIISIEIFSNVGTQLMLLIFDEALGVKFIDTLINGYFGIFLSITICKLIFVSMSNVSKAKMFSVVNYIFVAIGLMVFGYIAVMTHGEELLDYIEFNTFLYILLGIISFVGILEVIFSNTCGLSMNDSNNINNEIDTNSCHIFGLTGEYAGAEINVDGNLVFGKDPNICQIVLQDQSISRRHVEISYNINKNQYVVCDFSKNGTFVLVNGEYQRIREQVIYLNRGNEIALGNKLQTFKLG